MSEVKLIRMHSGEDVVATITNDTASSITIENAIVAVPTAQGQLGFAPWIPVLSKTEKSVTIDKKFVVFTAEPDSDVVTQYKSIYGGVIAPKKPSIII